MWENHRRHKWHLGTRVLAIMAASVICVTLPTDVMAQNELVIDANGDIGIGTDTPSAAVEIERDGPVMRWTNTGGAGGFWDFAMNANTGRLFMTDDPTNLRIPFKFDPGSDNNLLRVGVVSPDQVNINGHLVVSGTITPDYVFEPDYKLESIEEHAQLMWQKKHLPAVGQAVVDRSGSSATLRVIGPVRGERSPEGEVEAGTALLIHKSIRKAI